MTQTTETCNICYQPANRYRKRSGVLATDNEVVNRYEEVIYCDSCENIFHDTCLEHAIKESNQCPVCKEEIDFQVNTPIHAQSFSDIITTNVILGLILALVFLPSVLFGLFGS